MSQRLEAEVRRRTDRLVRQLATEIVRLREDAGLSRRALADAAGLDSGHLCRIEDAVVRPTPETYLRIATVLGADFNAHLYPTTGPTVHDRHQAPILEALLELLHSRWQPFTEVAVRRPSRGWIDVVLHDPRAGLLVATEIESSLRRVEQLVRWSREKADSLPSWDGWQRLDAEPVVSQLLIVRRTRANLAVARDFERQLRLAFPAHPADALASLDGSEPWPGSALLWATLDRQRVRWPATRNGD
jgi:transcriptional regulator with XRE-family HTH domain